MHYVYYGNAYEAIMNGVKEFIPVGSFNENTEELISVGRASMDSPYVYIIVGTGWNCIVRFYEMGSGISDLRMLHEVPCRNIEEAANYTQEVFYQPQFWANK